MSTSCLRADPEGGSPPNPDPAGGKPKFCLNPKPGFQDTQSRQKQNPIQFYLTHGKVCPSETAVLIGTKSPLDDDPASDNKLIGPVTLRMTNNTFRLSPIPKQKHQRQRQPIIEKKGQGLADRVFGKVGVVRGKLLLPDVEL